MIAETLRDRWRSVLRQLAHDSREEARPEAGSADAEPIAEPGTIDEPSRPEERPPPTSDRPEISEDMLTEHWLHHVRKLIDAGVPLQRIARSLRTASIQVDDDWFKWAMDEARERIDALGPGNTSTDLQAERQRDRA